MNPFIESTVARPLLKNHHDPRWSNPGIAVPAAYPPPCDIKRQHSPSVAYHQSSGSAHSQSSGTAHPDNPSSGGEPGTDPDVRKQRSGMQGCARLRGKSMWAAFGLGLSLLLSAASGTVSSPAVMTSAAVVAGILMPRPAQAMDLNKATAQELQTLNGVGPKTATMIVDERTRGGNFSSLSDLTERVRGIGPKKAAALQAAGLHVASPSAGNKTDAKAATSSPKR